jgi:acyl carrier protein
MSELTVEEEILALVSRKTGLPQSALKPEQRLLHDLGLDGDDAVELFLDVSRQFRVEFGGLRIENHFRPEPNIFTIFRTSSRRAQEIAGKAPITIADLIAAVKAGRWPDETT